MNEEVIEVLDLSQEARDSLKRAIVEDHTLVLKSRDGLGLFVVPFIPGPSGDEWAEGLALCIQPAGDEWFTGMMNAYVAIERGHDDVTGDDLRIASREALKWVAGVS